MRFRPKFEPTLEERPDIFNINMITAYVGGTHKVWSYLVQNEIYNDIFIKIAPVGISYSFTTSLKREELQELYLNDIKRRQTLNAHKAWLTKRKNKESDLTV
jgi:hypothetical protein